MAPRQPKMTPRWPQHGQGWPEDGPRWPKTPPKIDQVGPHKRQDAKTSCFTRFSSFSFAPQNRQDAKTTCFTRVWGPLGCGSKPTRCENLVLYEVFLALQAVTSRSKSPTTRRARAPGEGRRGINPFPFFLGLKIYVKFRYVLRQRDLNALGQRPRRISL